MILMLLWFQSENPINMNKGPVEFFLFKCPRRFKGPFQSHVAIRQSPKAVTFSYILQSVFFSFFLNSMEVCTVTLYPP